jgi:uncharacterized membrane protein YdbT with pleckstrin-like domain
MTTAEPEVVVARLRSHGRALFWPSLLLIAVAGATSFFAGNFPEPWYDIVLFAAAGLLVIFGVFVPLVSWLNHSYVITTRRIVARRGVVVRTRQELLHSRSYDVSVRQAGLQFVFGSGDVRINTGLEHPFVLRDVPHAAVVQSALHDLMEESLNPIAARRQQGEAG